MNSIYLFMIIINFLFLNSNNPLIMGLMLLIQTLNLIILLGLMHYNFWFSYIIFLIFIGGMLILFMYVISLINNKFYMKLINKYNSLLMSMLIIFMIYIKMNYNNMEMNMINKLMFLNENSLNLMKFYNFPNMFINIFMINYLFIMMMICTKITNFLMGPFFKF